MKIERFRPEEAEEVSALIIRTLRTTNGKDYSKEYLDDLILSFQPDNILKRAEQTHLYVVKDNKKIIGCGAIGPYPDKEDESCLYTIFVLPEYQGQGVGRNIMQVLEEDDLFLNTFRTEVPASITAVQFYLKLGYDYKPGGTVPDKEGLYRLEKFR